MTSLRNMTSGPPGRLILSFALPLMLGNLFQQFYTIADAAIVGQVLGVSGIAAVGAAEWIIWMMQGIIQGFTQGFGIRMSQDFGAGQYRSLRHVIVNSAFLSAVSALVLLAGGQIFAAWMLEILHTPETVWADTMLYMRAMFWGIPVVMAYNLFASVLRSLGDGKTPLYAMICASFINIGLDLFFVPVLGLGVFGAAAATVLAQLCSSLFCLIKMIQIDILKFQRADLEIDTKLHIRLMKLGTPMAFQNFVISVGGMIVQSVVNGFGVAFIAGFTATNKLYGMLEVAAVMIFAGKWILLCFINGDAKTTADTLAIAYRYLFIMSICLPVLYYLHVTRSCIQGLGNTVLPMVSGCAEFGMRTAAALLLPMALGQDGIFYAEIAAWAGADFVLFFSFFSSIRKISAIEKEKEDV